MRKCMSLLSTSGRKLWIWQQLLSYIWIDSQSLPVTGTEEKQLSLFLRVCFPNLSNILSSSSTMSSLFCNLHLCYVCPFFPNSDMNSVQKDFNKNGSQKPVPIVAQAKFFCILRIIKKQGGSFEDNGAYYRRGCVQAGASASTEWCTLVSWQKSEPLRSLQSAFLSHVQLIFQFLQPIKKMFVH